MKILFVSSGNSKNGISPIIDNQARSLESAGHEVRFFAIKGKGLVGYLKSIPLLRKEIRDNSFDIIHAHYSLSGFVAALSSSKKPIVSLMGSDVKSKSIYKIFVKIFINFFWSETIVKSVDMKLSLGLEELHIIPNGVNLELFKPMNQKKCKEEISWDQNKIQILFAADPERPVKNFELALAAFRKIDNSIMELKALDNIPNEKMPLFYGAADVILLTSLWEGSPNVIKEAMACNKPIVSTNVGDVKWLFGNIEGHYICEFDPKDVAENIIKASIFLKKNKYTRGAERINEIGLDSIIVSRKLVKIYEKVLK
jgi:teichuronic acid biosynthesis glycosyltransferase TuaC